MHTTKLMNILNIIRITFFLLDVLKNIIRVYLRFCSTDQADLYLENWDRVQYARISTFNFLFAIRRLELVIL